MSCNCHIRIQSVSLTHTQTSNTLSSVPGSSAARARIYPLGEPKSEKTKSVTKQNGVSHVSNVRCFVPALMMLTYLVASFVGFLHQHPPLVVQLHGHAAAAVGVFAHPAEELLQLPAQGGVGVGAGLGVAGARQHPLCAMEAEKESGVSRQLNSEFHSSLAIVIQVWNKNKSEM